MWSKHLHAFSRLLQKKDLQEELVTKIALYNLVKSTTLESTKSLTTLSAPLRLSTASAPDTPRSIPLTNVLSCSTHITASLRRAPRSSRGGPPGVRGSALPPRRRKLPARYLQAPGGASESNQYSLPQAVTRRGGAALIPRGIRSQAQGRFRARVCISVSFHRGAMGAPFPLKASVDRNVGYVDKRLTFIAWRRCRRGFPSSFLELKVHLHVCKFCACHVCTLLAREGFLVSIVSTAMTGRNNAVNRGDDRADRIVDTVSTLPRLRRLRAAWRIGYGAGIVPLSRIAAQPASHARCLRWCPRRFVQMEDLVEARSCRHCGGFRGSRIGRRALAAYGDVDGPSAATHRPWSSKETARVLRRSAARARAHGWAGTRRVRRGGAGRVG